jgi:hypothetical protein
MGLPENNNKSKTEYTNTQTELTHQNKDRTRHARLFGWWVCFAKSI